MGIKQRVIMIGLLVTLEGSAGFITNDEYAKMLYQNPRGIGCDKCHGKDGEGMVLSTYKNKKGEIVALKAPRIDNIPIKRFYNSFERKSKLMPVYFLTDDEKAYLYYYLTKKRAKREQENDED